MKRFVMILGLLLSYTALSNASNWGAKNAYPNTGDQVSMGLITVSTTTAATLSAYSPSRSLITCINTSNIEVYLGSSTAVTSQGAFAYELGPSTSTYNTFSMTNQGGLFAIGKAHAANIAAITMKVYCTEER